MRILGIDYGTKRIGIALGDTETRIASPWTVLTVDSKLDVLRRLHDMIELEQIERVVVGVPRHQKAGKTSDRTIKEIQSFINDVRAQGVEVETEDESLTTKMAAVQMQERGEKGKRDDLAAAAILQSWLDKKH
ncbi:Holliday junction resolvase RuvX [Candidatus Uhrbacteria bacterium]|nr:Holliday junction resolvase RuvX [Candidatus Uhrbacteria bacterium]